MEAIDYLKGNRRQALSGDPQFLIACHFALKDSKKQIALPFCKAISACGHDPAAWIALDEKHCFTGNLTVNLHSDNETIVDGMISIGNTIWVGHPDFELILPAQLPLSLTMNLSGRRLSDLVSHPLLDEYDIEIIEYGEKECDVPDSWGVDNPGKPRPPYLIEPFLRTQWKDEKSYWLDARKLVPLTT